MFIKYPLPARHPEEAYDIVYDRHLNKQVIWKMDKCYGSQQGLNKDRGFSTHYTHCFYYKSLKMMYIYITYIYT